MDFSALNKRIAALDVAPMEETLRRWDAVAKPLGSLGGLEALVVQLAGISGTADVGIAKRGAIVLCADNGVLAQGVAQTPGEVTAIMAGQIAMRRSSVCVMAKYAGADVISADIGMFHRVDANGLLDMHVANGTSDMSLGAAMTREQAIQAVQTGMDIVERCKKEGYSILVTGEMGIGNTTTASAIAAVLLGASVLEVTGRGAGLSDEGLMHKRKVIEKAIAVNEADKADAFGVLHCLGGFDIAGLVGVFLGGAINRIPIVIDGFISSVAALVAERLCPNALPYFLPSHVSAEPAGGIVLDALGLKPIINAGMRLGEGTGAICMLPMLDMALAVYHEACTYSEIGF